MTIQALGRFLREKILNSFDVEIQSISEEPEETDKALCQYCTINYYFTDDFKVGMTFPLQFHYFLLYLKHCGVLKVALSWRQIRPEEISPGAAS